MPSVRRLTADVAGYSRLMGVDEEGTHERLKAHLGELIDPKIAEHRGRIVKNTGDGLLAEFGSVVEAVCCAVEVQRGMTEREPDIPKERRIRFRIGVNLGDVIVEDEDIFGDGVNVAARLEALAEPEGICISRVVRDQIRDKLPYQFEDLGEQTVKNIARPVRVYALRTEGVAYPPASRVPAVSRRRRSAVVAAILMVAQCRSSSRLSPGGLGLRQELLPCRREQWQPPRPSHGPSLRRACPSSFCPLQTFRTIRIRNISPTGSPTI